MVDRAVDADAHRACHEARRSYPEVERILVNPGIKKKLCDTVERRPLLAAQGAPVLGP